MGKVKPRHFRHLCNCMFKHQRLLGCFIYLFLTEVDSAQIPHQYAVTVTLVLS